MTDNRKNQTNYSRAPARLMALEKRVEALAGANDQLLQLLATHFPALKKDAAQVSGILQQNMGLISSLEGDLMLRGHGPRGVQESFKLRTKNDNDKFVAGLVKPSDEPLEAQLLIETLTRYLQADAGEQGRVWVLPEEDMYGQLVKDGSKVQDTDIVELSDGIYVVKAEQGAFYTLRITLEDGILVFSPNKGPSLLTYNPLELQWTQHTSWKYANGPKAIAAIEKFFSASNVNDIKTSELEKLANTLNKMPKAKLEGLVEVNETGMDLPLNPIFKIRMPAGGEATIIGARDDIKWEDVTLYTRRQMFRDAVARVAKANSDGAPKTVAKAAAKKTAKKAAGK
jgi:hypothetical protein